MTSLSRSALWILDAAVLVDFFTLDMLANPAARVHFNRAEGHGLSHPALAETLLDLFEQGLIIAEQHDGVPEISQPFRPDREAIHAALAAPPRRWGVTYGLTPQGGAVWEHYARPDWDRYIDQMGNIDPHVYELAASTRSLVETYLAFAPMLLGAAPIAESVEWEVLQPWHATYWKELPVGHRVRFAYTVVETAYAFDSPEAQTYERAHTWRSAQDRWYSDPFRPER